VAQLPVAQYGKEDLGTVTVSYQTSIVNYQTSFKSAIEHKCSSTNTRMRTGSRSNFLQISAVKSRRANRQLVAFM